MVRLFFHIWSFANENLPNNVTKLLQWTQHFAKKTKPSKICQSGKILPNLVAMNEVPNSVTRHGKISPLWHSL